MAMKKSLSGSGKTIDTIKKKSRQGRSKHTKLAATSANGAKKRYRGQGK